MSKWREATEEEKQAWLSGHLADFVARETEHGLEVIRRSIYVRSENMADVSYGQGLWYAWGRMDADPEAYRGKAVDAFAFAKSVKDATLAFFLEETTHNESIQGAWERYVKSL